MAIFVSAAPDVLHYLVLTGAALVLMVVGLRSYFHAFVPEPPPRADVLREIQLMRERVESRVRAPAAAAG